MISHLEPMCQKKCLGILRLLASSCPLSPINFDTIISPRLRLLPCTTCTCTTCLSPAGCWTSWRRGACHSQTASTSCLTRPTACSTWALCPRSRRWSRTPTCPRRRRRATARLSCSRPPSRTKCRSPRRSSSLTTSSSPSGWWAAPAPTCGRSSTRWPGTRRGTSWRSSCRFASWDIRSYFCAGF